MDLTNKKINFLGDSITLGCCATDNRGFVDLLTRDCRLAAGRNYGIGGTRYARQRIPSEDPSYDQDFCGRYTQMDPDADTILVFGGVNDFGHGDAPMGAPSDRAPDTFRGACHFLYQGLLRRYPQSQTVILTPLHCLDETLPKPSKPPLSEYVQAIRQTAAFYNLPVIDLYETSALRFDLSMEHTADGLHPNDQGHAILAKEIAAALQKLPQSRK